MISTKCAKKKSQQTNISYRLSYASNYDLFIYVFISLRETYRIEH